MARLVDNGSNVGSALQDMMMAAPIVPGDKPSYGLCKTIYTQHPYGAKIAEEPIRVAQSQPREVTFSELPGIEQKLKEQWEKQAVADNQEGLIFMTASLARVYGIASLAVVSDDLKPKDPLPLEKVADLSISFNVFDPLNTSGSLVLSQLPNSPNFQKYDHIAVNGVPYHRTRAVAIMNESPIYIDYTPSGFGYVGRSAYQRALFPLKSFIQTMIADDMVAKKAGIIVAVLRAAGSIIDKAMLAYAAFKRAMIKAAVNEQILSIDKDEDVKAIDLTNVDGALSGVRSHILQNIAAAVPMPARMLNHETFAEGFGEGTEDAKAEARYIDGVRKWLQPLYAFLDPIIQQRAFNADFYKTIQTEFPEEYGGMPYLTWFTKVTNCMKSTWPNLLTEPDSEKIAVEDVRFRAVIAGAELLLQAADPENKKAIYAWVQDVFNNQKLLLGVRLDLDFDALVNYVPPEKQLQLEGQEAENKNLEGSFKPRGDSMIAYGEAITALRSLTQARGSGKTPMTPTVVPDRKTA